MTMSVVCFGWLYLIVFVFVFVLVLVFVFVFVFVFVSAPLRQYEEPLGTAIRNAQLDL